MKIPSRVLMTADTVGGVWTYALELGGGLAERGVQIGLAAMGGAPDAHQRRDAESISGLELFASPFKLEWMDEPWEDVERAGKWLLELERQYCPDVIHLNNYAHGSLPFCAPVVAVGHSCVLSWWRAVRGGDAPAEWDRYRDVVRTGLASADLVLAPTAAMLDALHEHYGPLKNAAVCPNGRSVAGGETGGLTACKQPFVFTAGRVWDEAKNLPALEQIAHELPWPVYVAGDNRHPSTQAARTCGACRYLGKLPAKQMLWWLERAAIYALPARYEPFGLSILEAALCGCALVLGDIASLREVWGDAAIYVNPSDPQALAEQLRRLIDRPERRIQLATRAHARALEWNSRRMVEAYLAAYDGLLSQARVA